MLFRSPRLSVSLSRHVSLSQCLSLSVSLSPPCLSLSVFLSVSLSLAMSLSQCLSRYVSLSLATCRSQHLSLSLSQCLSVSLSLLLTLSPPSLFTDHLSFLVLSLTFPSIPLSPFLAAGLDLAAPLPPWVSECSPH